METIQLTTKDKIAIALTDIDDEVFLNSIYNIINKVQVDKDFIPDDHILVLKEREEKFQKGELITYSLEDFKNKFEKEHGL